MRILWDGIRLSAPRGGIVRFSEDLIYQLAQMPDVHLLAACPKGAPGYACRGERFKQISLRNISLLDHFRLGRFRPDIFQGTYYAPPPCKVPRTVQIAYDFIDARFPAFFCNGAGFVERQREALQAADAVVAISHTTAEDAQRFANVAPQQIRIVYPSLSPVFRKPLPSENEIASVRNELTGGAPYWLWVGPRHHYKNLITFLTAFAACAKEHNTHLVLVGGSPLRLNDQEQSLVIRHCLWDRIHIEASVSDERLRLLYAAATGFIQSALWEGFGIPLTEAMASGTRLLVSDIPIFREVAGGHAIFVPPTEPEAWIAAMQSCLEQSWSPEDRLRGKRFAEERYDLERASRELYRLYQEIMGG